VVLLFQQNARNRSKKSLEPEPVYGEKNEDTQRERHSLNWCKLHTREQEAERRKKREGGDQSNDAVPDMQEKEKRETGRDTRGACSHYKECRDGWVGVVV
jgi:hypothetical protein